MFYATKYSVVPHLTFGYLPKMHISTWKKRNCDDHHKQKLINEIATTTCSNLSVSGQESIAIIVSTTSKSAASNPELKDLPLFEYMLPSLLRTIDCRHRYLIVIGYDKGDPYFDSVNAHQEIAIWFERRLISNGPSIQWRLLGFDNPVHKPGPIFIAAAKVAYDLDANYFFRVNDDTEILTRYVLGSVEHTDSLVFPFLN